jgi:CubicO group peptidase (beta-lactamase class C family)
MMEQAMSHSFNVVAVSGSLQRPSRTLALVQALLTELSGHLPVEARVIELGDLAPPGMFSEAGYSGTGFSLACGVNIDVARTRLPGTTGEFFWGGAASTAFWVDPKEDLAVVFMTQVIGSDARLTLRRDLRTLVYSAMTESFA